MTAPTRKVPRRVVRAQIAGLDSAYRLDFEALVLAHADDGSLWIKSNRASDLDWYELPPLPDREVPADDEIPF